jgi:hypothetical protein
MQLNFIVTLPTLLVSTAVHLLNDALVLSIVRRLSEALASTAMHLLSDAWVLAIVRRLTEALVLICCTPTE